MRDAFYLHCLYFLLHVIMRRFVFRQTPALAVILPVLAFSVLVVFRPE